MTLENTDSPIESNQSPQNGDTEPEDHPQETQPASPPPAAKGDAQPCRYHSEITCNTKRDWIDKLTLGLEGFGLFVLIVYTVATIAIWCANKKVAEDTHHSVLNADRNFRIDERAWIGFALEGVEVQKEVPSKKPMALLVPTSLVNTGKTPAKKVVGNLAITVIKKGEKLPLGDYTPGHTYYAINGNTVFPGGAVNAAMPAIKQGPEHAITIIPTDALMREIADGESFAVVYGSVTYCDIFGVPHSTQFCRYASRPGFIDNDCMNYNNADENEQPDPKSCPKQ